MSEARLHGVLSSYAWRSNDLLLRIQSGLLDRLDTVRRSRRRNSAINANRIA
jgi:hypothetical protein